jgi:Integrase core domain
MTDKRQSARAGGRGDQVGSVRSGLAYVRRTADRTIRREYLDRGFFWNAVDLARKLKEYEDYYNACRVHRSLGGTTPAQCAGAPSAAPASLDRHAWRQHCRGLFQTPIAV